MFKNISSWHRAAKWTAALLGLALSWTAPADARTTKIIIDTTTSIAANTNPPGASSPISATVAYTLQVGRILGELDPADAHNTVIQDIALAPLNGNGKVGYIGTISILKPSSGANGVMLYQVSNRGGRSIPSAATVSPGATYVWTGWQGDLLGSKANCLTAYPCTDLNTGPYNQTGGVEVLQVPVARNADSSSITGPVYGSVINTGGSTAQLIIYTNPVPYRPATLDTTQATLWSVTNQSITGVETGKVTLASTDWAWADCRTTAFPGTPDPTRICLRNGFSSALLYQIVYTAKDPLVLGIGFAATRDAVSFLRDSAADDFATPNPLAGAIAKTVAMGTSQSGNYLRTFTYYGFNQTEANTKVFDVIWPHIAGRQLWMNTRFALPDVIQMVYMAADEAPVWWADYVDNTRGRAADGILHRCTANNTCPKVVETYGALEFWALKASPDHVGASGAKDIPLPASVSRYYFPGTTHGGGGGGFSTVAGSAPNNCTLPANPNPESDQFSALLDDVVAYATAGTPMPASSYPKLSLGQLVPATQAQMNFPNIPGFPFVPNLVNPFLNYNFGPQFDAAHQTGIITIQPPTVLGQFPSYVVRTNSDGNEVAGVPSVNHQAPLGTYTGWNVWSTGGRKGEVCNLNGSFWPFQATKALRLAAGDPRPSLEERYGTHAGFVCVVTLAANQAVKNRFLRASSASALIAAASASTVLTTGFTPTTADNARATFYCNATRPE